MNTVTIKFGQGTAAWKDMQEVLKILQKKVTQYNHIKNRNCQIN